MSDVNWDRVVSMVATPEGLQVVERGSDGTLGAPQVLAPIRRTTPGRVIPGYPLSPPAPAPRSLQPHTYTHETIVGWWLVKKGSPSLPSVQEPSVQEPTFAVPAGQPIFKSLAQHVTVGGYQVFDEASYVNYVVRDSSSPCWQSWGSIRETDLFAIAKSTPTTPGYAVVGPLVGNAGKPYGIPLCSGGGADQVS